MSVNGLGSISKECNDVGRNNVPLKLERDRVYNVYVQGDQQTSGTLVPTEMKSQPQITCRLPHEHMGPPTRTTKPSRRSTSCCRRTWDHEVR